MRIPLEVEGHICCKGDVYMHCKEIKDFYMHYKVNNRCVYVLQRKARMSLCIAKEIKVVYL